MFRVKKRWCQGHSRVTLLRKCLSSVVPCTVNIDVFIWATCHHYYYTQSYHRFKRLDVNIRPVSVITMFCSSLLYEKELWNGRFFFSKRKYIYTLCRFSFVQPREGEKYLRKMICASCTVSHSCYQSTYFKHH